MVPHNPIASLRAERGARTIALRNAMDVQVTSPCLTVFASAEMDRFSWMFAALLVMGMHLIYPRTQTSARRVRNHRASREQPPQSRALRVVRDIVTAKRVLQKTNQYEKRLKQKKSEQHTVGRYAYFYQQSVDVHSIRASPDSRWYRGGLSASSPCTE